MKLTRKQIALIEREAIRDAVLHNVMPKLDCEELECWGEVESIKYDESLWCDAMRYYGDAFLKARMER